MSALVALCSPAMGSGKSTVANHLVERHGFELVKFAGPLKRMTTALLGACGISSGVVARMVDGDLKEVPIGDVGSFQTGYAYIMFEAMGPLPEEVEGDWTEGALIESLWAWGRAALKPTATSRAIQQELGSAWGRNTIHPDLWRLVAREEIQHHRAAGRALVIDDVRFPNELELVLTLGGRPIRVIRHDTAVTRSHESEGQLDVYTMDELVNDGTIAELVANASRLIGL